MNLLWSIEMRFGFGLDIESCDTRPVWAVKDGEFKCMSFDGLVLNIPFFVLTVGNVWEEVD